MDEYGGFVILGFLDRDVEFTSVIGRLAGLNIERDNIVEEKR